MRVSVKRWGNSLALRIPSSVAEDTRIKDGSVVEVSVVRGRLGVAPVVSPRYTLKQLLARVTRANRMQRPERANDSAGSRGEAGSVHSREG